MNHTNTAAGLLMFRKNFEELEYFLVHPGGPFFKNKNEGSWTIPKGLPEHNESLIETAMREFEEETGIKPHKFFFELGSVKQKGGKTVFAWAFEGQWDPAIKIKSNEFELEWPPRSGRKQMFPEIDDAKWFTCEEAMKMINPAQAKFILTLKEKICPKTQAD